MKPANIIPSLILIVTGVVFCVASSRIGLGEFHNPGPGLIPFLEGGFLILFSLGVIIEAHLKTEMGVKTRLLEAKRSRIVWLTMIFFFAYSFSLDILGFLLSTFLILIYLFKISKGGTWKSALILSLITTAASYWVFGYLLKIQLPKGFLGV
jgi:putative tricarboxylic transport membrane protein